jgi:glycerophosphoryl diester phosphodiesterase
MSSFFLPQVWQLARLLPAVPVAQLLHSASRIPPSWFPLELSGAAGAHPQFELLSPRFISKLRARVDFVGTWTVNDPKEARLAAKWGVDTIITDVPDIILAAL